jgi:exosortase/archaeosortase family protein
MRVSQWVKQPFAFQAGNFSSIMYNPAFWLVLGAVTLAIHPIIWLVNTWTDLAYDSSGLWVFAIVVALSLWSWTSPRLRHSENVKAIALLATSSVARLTGQLLAINSIAALTLVVDVYAIATLAGFQYRKNAISPFWLATLFALSLPLERILQRTIGYGLQQISAWGACGGLGLFNDEVSCQGVRILLAGQDVLVDLPCSGARGLLLFALVFVVAAAIKRPTIKQALVGMSVCIAAAIISNIFRIIFLALGIAYPQWFGGINIMTSPWHDIVGFIALCLGVVPLLWWGQQIVLQDTTYLPIKQTKPFKALPHGIALPISIAFCVLALLILQTPAKPIDVARVSSPPLLPSNLLGVAGKDDPLSKQEQVYFRRFGGGASRKFFGDSALLVVRTSAPLRHLHAPDECLRGSGHDVQYVGMDNRTIPTAVYRSIDPSGQPWRIRVSFVSNDGQQFHNVAAAVWHWIQHPGSTWSQIQRITPWSEVTEDADRFDAAALRALDIPLMFGCRSARCAHDKLSTNP